MNNLKEKWLILGILILALCMRVHFMTRSFFYDELYTAVHGMQAPSFLDALFKNYSETNHLGYTAIAYLTCHILGIKEWTMRLPALLFGLGSILLFWHWARKYFGWATAMLGALFLALAPAHIIWSASARGYSACVFFAILSTSLYFSLLEKPSLKTSLWLTLVNTIAISFQIYSLFVLLAKIIHFSWNSIRSNAKQASSHFPLSVASTILCSILIYFPALTRIKGIATDPNHRELIPGFPLTLLHDLLSLPLWPLGVLCLILMIIGFMQPNKKIPHWGLYTSILFLMIFPLWLLKPVYLYPRFFAYLLPFIFLLLANGIVCTIKNAPVRARACLLVIMALIISAVFGTWVFKPSKIVNDFFYKFRESVAFAESISSPQTSFCAFGNEDDFFQFYSDRPVATFKTFEDFVGFYRQEDKIICFAMMGPPMSDEHKKIVMFLFQYVKPKITSFDNIMVSDVKG